MTRSCTTGTETPPPKLSYQRFKQSTEDTMLKSWALWGELDQNKSFFPSQIWTMDYTAELRERPGNRIVSIEESVGEFFSLINKNKGTVVAKLCLTEQQRKKAPTAKI